MTGYLAWEGEDDGKVIELCRVARSCRKTQRGNLAQNSTMKLVGVVVVLEIGFCCRASVISRRAPLRRTTPAQSCLVPCEDGRSRCGASFSKVRTLPYSIAGVRLDALNEPVDEVLCLEQRD